MSNWYKTGFKYPLQRLRITLADQSPNQETVGYKIPTKKVHNTAKNSNI